MQAILSSIIVVALQRMFIKVMDVKKYYELSIPDMVSPLLSRIFYYEFCVYTLCTVYMDSSVFSDSVSWS